VRKWGQSLQRKEAKRSDRVFFSDADSAWLQGGRINGPPINTNGGGRIKIY